jgi:hypothetical protein
LRKSIWRPINYLQKFEENKMEDSESW